MNCCHGGRPENGAPPTRARSAVGAAIEWAVPLIGMALIPKCPACLGGYLFLFTGIGLSLPVAAALRWALLAVGAGALVYLAIRTVHRAVNACPEEDRSVARGGG